jgi:hypothetical protein
VCTAESTGSSAKGASACGCSESAAGSAQAGEPIVRTEKTCRRCRNTLPQAPQPLDSLLGQVAGNDGRVDGPDRDASDRGCVKTRLPSFGAHDRVAQPQALARMIRSRPARRSRIAGCRYGTAFSHSLDPIRMQVGLGQSLVDAGLVGAERTAALQHQRDALEWRPLYDTMCLRQRKRATDRFGRTEHLIPLSVNPDPLREAARALLWSAFHSSAAGSNGSEPKRGGMMRPVRGSRKPQHLGVTASAYTPFIALEATRAQVS